MHNRNKLLFMHMKYSETQGCLLSKPTQRRNNLKRVSKFMSVSHSFSSLKSTMQPWSANLKQGLCQRRERSEHFVFFHKKYLIILEYTEGKSTFAVRVWFCNWFCQTVCNHQVSTNFIYEITLAVT